MKNSARLSSASGVHPWYVSESDRDIKFKLDKASGMGAVAVGEIGLDRKIESPPFELQREIFELQLQYAVETDTPAVFIAAAHSMN